MMNALRVSILRRYYRSLLAVTLSVLLVLAAVPKAHAQVAIDKPGATQTAIGVSPAIIESALKLGQPQPFSILVSNSTNFPLPIKGFVRDMTVQGDYLAKNDRDRLDASRWFTIQDPDFILQPNQIRTVEGTITAPKGASPGGHYATVYFQPLVPPEILTNSTAFVNARVGVLSFLIVAGDIVERAVPGDQLYTKHVIQRGTADLSFSISNTGNVHLLPAGSLKIYDWRNKQVATINLPTGMILPGTTKNYQMHWKPPGLVGKYHAEVSATYGPDNTPIQTMRTDFWMVPWKRTVVIAIMLLTVIPVGLRVRHRWRKAWKAFSS